jgi:hypothetical protein
LIQFWSKPMARTGQITASTLNLRTSPNTSSTILSAFPTGTLVEILDTVTGGSYSLPSGGTSNQWLKAKVGAEEGFVAAAFVIETGTPDGTHKVLDAIFKVNAEHPYYKARDITGDGIKEPFCNWFVADVLDQLGIDLPRLDASAGSYVEPHPIYGFDTPFKPFSAEALFKFFEKQNASATGTWKLVSSDTADKASAQSAAISIAQGDKVVVASYPGVPNRHRGHMAIVRPDSTGTNVRIAQAGSLSSSNNLALSAGFIGTMLAETKFFTL